MAKKAQAIPKGYHTVTPSLVVAGVGFFVYGDNVDAAWKRAVDAGAKEIMPLADQF